MRFSDVGIDKGTSKKRDSYYIDTFSTKTAKSLRVKCE